MRRRTLMRLRPPLPEHIGKPLPAVQKRMHRLKPALHRHKLRLLETIFLRDFHMDRLILAEAYRLIPDMHLLCDPADQITLTRTGTGIIYRIMLELVNIEISAQFAIDTRE